MSGQRRYRERYPERVRESNRKADARRRELMGAEAWREWNQAKWDRYRAPRRAIIDAAKCVPCTDCGRSYPPPVMEFDHRDDTTKLFTISQMVGMAPDLIRAEIAKCDVVCANCHRLREIDKGWRRDLNGQRREDSSPWVQLTLDS